ncbi:MAG TPA: flavodoxin domain-containing protein [Bacteroidales bacterium]|nr:flavodoxin domain-containing protein [Bacteroidales bacterium]
MDKRSFVKRGILGTIAVFVSGKAYNLEYYPMPSGKKWAILYGTWCGSARDAGLWISEGMDGIANVFDARENPDLSGYDYVVIGGAIRAGKTTPELIAYIEKNKNILKSKIRGYFALCGNMMRPAGPAQVKSMIDDHIAALCGVSGMPSAVFLGRITYGLMDADSRKMMESMGMKEYDNLKRPECMAFGKQVLTATAS